MLSQILNTNPSPFTPSFDIPYNLPSYDLSNSLTTTDIPQYPQKAGKWTFEEDELLKKYVQLYGEKQWRKISLHIPGRTPIQCLHRWSKILRPGLVKGPWTLEEDQKLIAWVKTEGPNKWAQAANVIEGRSGKQCRERWFNNLNPDVKKGEWTKEEDELIFELYRKYGSSWSKIAKFVPGRTENSIKNRFYSTLRKISADRKKVKSSKSSPSESSQMEENENDDGEESSKTNDEASSTEQLPHTLYKLLQESNIIEMEKGVKEESSDHEPMLKENPLIITAKQNEPLSAFRKNSVKSVGSSFSFGGDNVILDRDCSIVRKPLGGEAFSREFQVENEDSSQHFEKFLLAMDKRVQENFITKEFESSVKPDNLFMLGLVQQKIANYCHNNIGALSSDLNSLFTSLNNAPIISISQSPAPKKEKRSLKRRENSDLSNPIELKLEDNSNSAHSFDAWKKTEVPKLTPLQVPSAFNLRNYNSNCLTSSNYMRPSSDISSISSKIIIPESFKPCLSESRNMSLPIIANNNRLFQEKSDLSGFVSVLKSKKETSQCSLSTQESIPDHQDEINTPLSDLSKEARSNELSHSVNQTASTVSEMQQNCFNKLMEVIKAVPKDESDEAESKMTFLFSQLHSLENLFGNVKGQLMKLETSLHEMNSKENVSPNRNDTNFEVKVEAGTEDTIEKQAKRPLENIYVDNKSEGAMKKVKLI